MPVIRIEAPDGFRGRLALDKDRITIGRSRDSDIPLPDLWLSRHHAQIRRRGDTFFLRDLGSTNGTRLNGELIDGERPLRPGDVISLSEYVLTVCDDDEAGDDREGALSEATSFPARDVAELGTRSGVASAHVKRQQRTLGTLTRAATALLAPRPLEDLYGLVLDLLFEAVPAERGAVALVAGDQTVLAASRSREGPALTKVSRSVVRRVTKERLSLLIPRVLEDPAFSGQESIRSEGIRSALSAPLWITGASKEEDKVIGLVYLDTRKDSPPFTEEDLRIVTAIANLTAAKIESMRLQSEMAEKRRLEEDLRRAAEIQSVLLPSVVPRIAGYDIAGCNVPGNAVGGGYYDFLLDSGRLLFALGDVAGKGTGAALLVSLLRTSVRAHWTDNPPGEAARWINRTLCQSVPENRYATLLVARLEPGSGRIAYVNAGHHPPLLVRRDATVDRLREGGAILGPFPAATFEEGATILGRGDLLVVFSDGVVEAAASRGGPPGDARLTEVAIRERHRSAVAVQEAILREPADQAGGAPTNDDRTLIVLKRE
jgi:serine phosphatase RsbU (regulator of sigma subunit)